MDDNRPQVYVADTPGERLDQFLVRVLADCSRSRGQKLIEAGLATVAGKKVKANYRLNDGDEVTVVIPPPAVIAARPENIPLSILYEDGDMIVVDKARGMAVHPAPGVSAGTLVNALLYHCHDLSGIGGDQRPGIVHRLDKDTTGVMVAAKNDAAHRGLSAQIGNKTAQRVYLAIVRGVIAEDDGIIHGAIGRDPKDRQKMAVVPDGKPASTKFHVLERYREHTLIECRLLTGRTHQIRVHLTYIGYPIFGDPKYGSRRRSPWDDLIKGQALHSHTLTLAHPRTGEPMKFTAPLPADMAALIDALAADKIAAPRR